MGTTPQTDKLKVASTEQIIGSIRNIRDRKIEELMKETFLLDFLECHFKPLTMSQIKVSFLKKELAELKNSSLDLSYYSSLIIQTKESDNRTPPENHPLFLQELQPLFQKYAGQSAFLST